MYICRVKMLEELISRYQSSDHIKKLRETVSGDTAAVFLLEGLAGGQDAFIMSGLFLHGKAPQLFIAEHKDQAAYYYNTLETLLGEQTTFFPDSFKRPGNFEEINQGNVQLRTEIAGKLGVAYPKPFIIISYPEALFEKVVKPEMVDAMKIRIEKGEPLDVETMIELMVSYDFKREEYVYEPGQFSIRGGIIDVFNFANEWPYRIELVDDEVESIRMFDPVTQLSVRSIEKLTIIPNVNSRFSSRDKVSLLEILPKNTVIWVKHPESLTDTLVDCFEKVSLLETRLTDPQDDLSLFFRERAFILPNELINRIKDFNTLIQGNTAELDIQIKEKIIFSGKVQTHFNRNFKLLIEDLETWTEKDYATYLWVGNDKQIKRFKQVFEDLKARIEYTPIPLSIHEGFVDHDQKIVCYTDHQIFRRHHAYSLRTGYSKDKAINIRMLRELQKGDFITHIDHGIGVYSGLEKISINGNVQEAVKLLYKNKDILWVSINSLHKISKYSGKEGSLPVLDKLGSDRWKKLKAKTKKQIKDIAQDLILLYAKRKSAVGFSFPADDYMQAELEACFMYEDTPDQASATEAVKDDMLKAYPMDRLICGDVGFGKTEIAVRAAFKAVLGGKQVAILVPTTILALQHFRTFNERLQDFNVRIDYINRFRTTAEKTLLYKKIKEGTVDIVIGTHALLNQKTMFKDLGLLVLDEEQKFGVAAKEKLRSLKVNVDTLTLTATPIPRTLQFSLLGARDMSILRTAPPNRQPIYTERRVFSEHLIVDAINFEVDRGGQVFFIHNRVKNLAELTSMIKNLLPDVRIAMAHGQMEGKQLEKTLLDFIDKKFDVLISTNIIETGLDIPNANTMIINNAHQFGLSDLHQLRGRVGRSNKQAFCYLFAPPLSTLTTDARLRLKTLEDFSDLGSGLDISMRDLDIRGAGNLLGAEQSGFITDIGYETYEKILEEAIMELKENEFKELFAEENPEGKTYIRDVEVDTDIEMLIPSEYISQTQERLHQYNVLDRLQNEEGIAKFIGELVDRYGKVPNQIHNLIEGLRIRWKCKELGFERFSLKDNKMRCFFIANPSSSYFEGPVFNHIMQYVNLHGKQKQWTLKQTPRHLILIRETVRSLKGARLALEEVERQAQVVEV